MGYGSYIGRSGWTDNNAYFINRSTKLFDTKPSVHATLGHFLRIKKKDERNKTP